MLTFATRATTAETLQTQTRNTQKTFATRATTEETLQTQTRNTQKTFATRATTAETSQTQTRNTHIRATQLNDARLSFSHSIQWNSSIALLTFCPNLSIWTRYCQKSRFLTFNTIIFEGTNCNILLTTTTEHIKSSFDIASVQHNSLRNQKNFGMSACIQGRLKVITNSMSRIKMKPVSLRYLCKVSCLQIQKKISERLSKTESQ